MKRYLLIPVLSGVIILAGCAVKNNSTVTPSQQNNVANPVVSTTLSNVPISTSSTVNVTPVYKYGTTLIYKNEKYGFQLTLTDAWKNYRAVEYTDHVDLGVPTKDTTWNHDAGGFDDPLEIAIYTKSAWAESAPHGNDSSPGTGGGVYITENNDYVFAYVQSDEVAKDLKNVNFNIPQIIKSFKLISPVVSSAKNIFVDSALGVKIVFPKGYSVLDKNSIIFDLCADANNCGYGNLAGNAMYKYSLDITATRSAEQIQKNESGVKLEKINGLEVATYSFNQTNSGSGAPDTSYDGPNYWLEVIGSKNNYVFSTFSPQDFDYFRSIIKTMEFTK